MTAKREGQQVDTLPSQLYGVQSDGTVTKIAVDSSGKVKVSADPLTVQGIQFDLTNPTSPVEEGLLVWNAEDGTLEVGMPGGNVALQIGQEQLVRAKASEDISNGDAVYISGASGSRPTANLAQADSDATSHGTIGIATEAISSGQNGFICTFGYVRDMNTSGGAEAWNAGDAIYLSPTVAGGLTNVKPTADYVVHIGTVLRAHATEGILFTNVNVVHPLTESKTDLTQGSVLFIDANGFITEDNSKLFWDSGSNRLGIGTSSPSSDLHVAGSITAQNIEDATNTASFNFEEGSIYGGNVAYIDVAHARLIVDSSIVVSWSTGNLIIPDFRGLQFGDAGAEGTIYSDGTDMFIANFLGTVDLNFTGFNQYSFSSGNVGIGTTSPDELLEVAGVSIPKIRITNNDNKTWSVGDIGSHLDFYFEDTSGNFPAVGASIRTIAENTLGSQWGLGFYTNKDLAGGDATEKIRIDPDGYMGINNTSPSTYVDITNDSLANAISIRRDNDIYKTMVGFIQAGTVGSSNPTWSFGIPNSSADFSVTTWNGTSLIERLAIDVDGYVGIGNVTPANQLHVKSTDFDILKLQRSTANGANLVFANLSGELGSIGGLSTNELTFRIGGSASGDEKMRIDSNGNVGIGTDSPTELLDVDSDSIRLRNSQTPASATATGTQGQIAWDSSYIYVCISTNTWVRSALSTW